MNEQSFTKIQERVYELTNDYVESLKGSDYQMAQHVRMQSNVMWLWDNVRQLDNEAAVARIRELWADWVERKGWKNGMAPIVNAVDQALSENGIS